MVSPIITQPLKASKYSISSMLYILNKNKYLIFFFLSILPTLIKAIKMIIESGNPIYPLLEVLLTITNADRALDILVDTLKNHPEEYIVPLASGIMNWFSHYWSMTLLTWNILGKIVLIAFPFYIIHKIVKMRDTSQPAKNFIIVFIGGFIFLLIFNLLFTIYEISTGQIDLGIQSGKSTGEIIKNLMIIILYTLPFKGVFNLIFYLSGIKIPTFRS